MPAPERTPVANVFEWSDEVTIRLGAEQRVLAGPDGGPKRLALRVGYVFDGKTTNPQYPSAFGTPPGPTHVLTAGAGWLRGRWRFNAAYAHRFGEGRVRPDDVKNAPKPCAFCSAPGKEPYRLAIHAVYLDASYALE
jgi:hypothetical protein